MGILQHLNPNPLPERPRGPLPVPPLPDGVAGHAPQQGLLRLPHPCPRMPWQDPRGRRRVSRDEVAVPSAEPQRLQCAAESFPAERRAWPCRQAAV